MTDMDTSPPDGAARDLAVAALHLAGTAGLAVAATAACSKMSAVDPIRLPYRAPPRRRVPHPVPWRAQRPRPLSHLLRRLTRPQTWCCAETPGALRHPAPAARPTPSTRMTIHHTAVVLGDNRNAPARLRQHQRYHQDTQGWIDIAYHMSVDRNGNIYQLRRSATRWRHRDELRPHRPLPRRMRRKLR